jgi:UDP-N-acetyl-2-amino-2-deoxyglucuronate dehydrogenase
VSAELFLGRPAPATPPPAAWGSWVAEGGGLLGALGSHFIDGFRHWFGDVASATGTLSTLRPERVDPESLAPVRADADDTFTFTLTFANGVVATMTASSAVSPGQGARILVTGTDGVLIATQRGPNPDPDGVVLAAKATEREAIAMPVEERFRPFTDDRDHRLVAFRLLLREFARGIREGTSPAPSFADGARGQAVLDAIRTSSREGRRVDL